MSIEQDLDRWEQDVKRICGDFHVSPPAAPHVFAGSIQGFEWGGVPIAHIQTNAARVRRTRAGQQDDRFCFLVIQRRGIMGIRQNGDYLSLCPGEMALLDSSRPLEICPQGFIDQISVHLPRHLLLDSGNAADAPRPGKLSPETPCTPLLRELLHQVESFPRVPVCQEDGMALQTAMLSLLGRARSATCSAGDYPMTLRERVERHVADHLDQNDLAPARIARALGMSLRQLYRLFEGEAGGVARYVMHQRLKRCAAELLDTSSVRPSITAIAYKWGFYDSAQFSRSFRRWYGCSPSEYRNHAPGAHPVI